MKKLRYTIVSALLMLVALTPVLRSKDAIQAGKGRSADSRKNEVISGIEMIYINGGSFIMGIPGDENCQQHKVELSSFLIGKYEVTRKQYLYITGLNLPHFPETDTELLDLPAENISWYDAVEFCNMLSERNGIKPYYKIDRDRTDPDNTNGDDNLKYTVTIAGGNGFRLPTEAEWEYACRAGTITTYYWGDDMDGDYCWNYSNSGRKSHPVGHKKPNAFGLYDMSGNVWEWCWDRYGPYDGTIRNPEGSAGGGVRVMRGGSWVHDGFNLGSAMRNWAVGTDKGVDSGFRIARDAE